MPPASPGISVDAGGKLLLGAFQEMPKSTQANCQSWEKEQTLTLLSPSIGVLLHLHCYSPKPFSRCGRTHMLTAFESPCFFNENGGRGTQAERLHPLET